MAVNKNEEFAENIKNMKNMHFRRNLELPIL